MPHTSFLGSALSTKAAQNLLCYGYATIPFNNRYYAELLKYFQQFLMSTSDIERDQWTVPFVRPDGRSESDEGYFCRGGINGQDLKHVLHYRLSFPVWLRDQGIAPTSSQESLLRTCKSEFQLHWGIVLELAGALDRISNLGFSFKTQLIKTFVNECDIPTCAAVLRLIYYPPQTQDQNVVGRPHRDRCFFTLHAGGRGGKLYARLPNGKEVDISPEEGEAVVFWGEKAEILAAQHGSKISSLIHFAESEGEKQRLAAVSFWHAPIELWDHTPV